MARREVRRQRPREADINTSLTVVPVLWATDTTSPNGIGGAQIARLDTVATPDTAESGLWESRSFVVTLVVPAASFMASPRRAVESRRGASSSIEAVAPAKCTAAPSRLRVSDLAVGVTSTAASGVSSVSDNSTCVSAIPSAMA